MKKTKYLLALLFLTIMSCEKELATPADTCRLTTIDRGNSNKHTYTYDTNGKIGTMTREFDGNGSGNISKYVYSFTYDATGVLSSSTWTLNGAADGKETYAYNNGKIAKANFEYADGSKGVNNIKLDLEGRITEFSYEAADKSYHDIQYFEYDANGIMTKRGVKDAASGLIYFEYRSKPVGIAKPPERYLQAKGLPYDMLTGFSWSSNIGGDGTSGEAFFADEKGVLVSDGTDKVLSVITDAKGNTTEINYENADKSKTKSTFGLSMCN
jgi:YD repeat-containing protein